MKNRTTLLLLFLAFHGFSQQITGSQLLEKAIKFHDPNKNWETFSGTFYVTMNTPNRSPRESKITIDLSKEFFRVRANRETITHTYKVDKAACSSTTYGLEYSKLTEEERKKKIEEDCKKAHLYKNYYTYLYGLPMKLKDEGTILHERVEKKRFKGKDYLVLKVTYPKEIGKDTWYFYFNPKTYAMEVYQFFKDESKNDGEYILLSELETINDIKMPKIRAWYYNNNNEYLGTDILAISNK